MKNITKKDYSRIMITVSEGSIARNILRSFVLQKLLEKTSASVVLLVPPEKAELYRKEFANDRVSIAEVPRTFPGGWEKAFVYLCRNGFKTETILTDQRTRLLIDKKYFRFFVKRLFIFTLGSMSWFHYLLRFLASFRPVPKAISDVFDREVPDLLYVTDVQDELDVASIAAAKKRGIRVIGMVRSWDNLTSGAGLIQIIPDKLIVWTPYLYSKAITVQHIPKEKVVIVGIPHFDWYKKEELFQAREEFFAELGLDPKWKLIVHAGIGNYHAPHDAEVAEVISGIIEKEKLDVQFLFRPHPNFLVDEARIEKLPHTKFDTMIATYTSKEKTSWEMDRGAIGHLVNTLRFADLVITTASTITMDAVSFGKPVICIAFDGLSLEPYWNSTRRYYFDYTHYIDISKTKGFKIAFSKDKLSKQIKAYLDNPREDEEGRQRLFNEFIWKLDGMSAERMAEAVLS